MWVKKQDAQKPKKKAEQKPQWGLMRHNSKHVVKKREEDMAREWGEGSSRAECDRKFLTQHHSKRERHKKHNARGGPERPGKHDQSRQAEHHVEEKQDARKTNQAQARNGRPKSEKRGKDIPMTRKEEAGEGRVGPAGVEGRGGGPHGKRGRTSRARAATKKTTRRNAEGEKREARGDEARGVNTTREGPGTTIHKPPKTEWRKRKEPAEK